MIAIIIIINFCEVWLVSIFDFVQSCCQLLIGRLVDFKVMECVVCYGPSRFEVILGNNHYNGVYYTLR